MELINELLQRTHYLETDALEELRQAGIEKANAEREYRKALRIEILIERDKGTPVTIINDIVKGKEDIADLRFLRDIADTNYQVAYESALIQKKNLDIISKQVDREWSSADDLF